MVANADGSDELWTASAPIELTVRFACCCRNRFLKALLPLSGVVVSQLTIEDLLSPNLELGAGVHVIEVKNVL